MQVNAAGVAGTDSTFGDEVAVTGLLGRTSLSVGQFHFQTEGFRENNDLQHNIYTVFGQSDLTENLSLQAEYRHRDTDRGDRELQFDLDDFDSTLRDDIEEDVFRVGGRLTPAPGQVGLVSAIYTDREDRAEFDDGTYEDDLSTKVGQIEGQYQGAFGPLQLVAGAGRAVADARLRRSSDEFGRFVDETARRQGERHLSHGEPGADPALDLTARLGYADVDIEPKDDLEPGFEDQTAWRG